MQKNSDCHLQQARNIYPKKKDLLLLRKPIKFKRECILHMYHHFSFPTHQWRNLLMHSEFPITCWHVLQRRLSSTVQRIKQKQHCASEWNLESEYGLGI